MAFSFHWGWRRCQILRAPSLPIPNRLFSSGRLPNALDNRNRQAAVEFEGCQRNTWSPRIPAVEHFHDRPVTLPARTADVRQGERLARRRCGRPSPWRAPYRWRQRAIFAIANSASIAARMTKPKVRASAGGLDQAQHPNRLETTLQTGN